MDNHHILVISENDKLARESLAKLIKDLRGNATQREFARLLGTSYTAVQDWEKQIRLPNDKNLKRIAELKGWTQEELVRYIFRTDPQFEIEGVDPVEHIIAQTRNLSLAQMQQLLEHLNTQFVEIQKVQEQKVQEQVVGYCLSDKQKHNLHLLLQASLKNQNLMEAMTQSEIEPELFTDVFLRNDKNRVVVYEDLEKFSGLCHRIIEWRVAQLPKIDRSQTYLGKTELLFNDLTDGDSAIPD